MIKDRFHYLNDKEHKNIGQIVRFGIVGLTATLIQYGVYWILIHIIGLSGHMANGSNDNSLFDQFCL